VARGNFDLVAVQLADKKVVRFQQSDADESGGRFSPDGRYVAFGSDRGGQPEVYLAPFPGPGGVRTVSTGAGSMPRWSRDGRELFYVGPNGSVSAVPIRTAPVLDIGRPQLLFSRGSRDRWVDYEAAPDGTFVALEPVSFAARQPLHLILNWRVR